MREHPVPQDITGYNFHIIGEMTIKQFAEVAVGVVIAVIIYTTNLPMVIKVPLMVFSAGLGALAAFVPFEEQPVDHWIFIFFKTLYKPTKFFWRKSGKIPDTFTFESNVPKTQFEAEIDLTPARRQRVKDYLTSIEETRPVDELEAYQQSRLASILDEFGQGYMSAPTAQPQSQTETTVVWEDRSSAQIPKRAASQPTAPNASYQVPEVTMVRVAPQDETALGIDQPEPKPALVQPLEEVVYQANQQSLDTAGMQAITQNVELPFPSPPTEPNKLVGMVLSQGNDIINDAIVEIQNAAGSVVRAVKTNFLGQFFVTTPLADGQYILQAEKEGYQFAPQQLILDGRVVQPLEVRSAT